MTATGIVRYMDDLGRIVIPKEIRRRCGFKDNDPLVISTNIALDGTPLVALMSYKNSLSHQLELFEENITNALESFDHPQKEKVKEAHRLIAELQELLKNEG